MALQRIGILTGGGDVPGLNSVIKTFVERMTDEGRDVLGLLRGWAALLQLEPDDEESRTEWIRPLDRAVTRDIDLVGGTFLHTSRLNPARLQAHQIPERLRAAAPEPAENGNADLTAHVLETLAALDLDALVAIGGDGTLAFAKRLHQEGFPVIAIPKTMDNDVWGTDYSIGFSTAVSRSVKYIHQLRTSASSHERLLIVELFGRHSGEPCLLASHLTDVDRALIAEAPYVEGDLFELLAADRAENPRGYAILTVAEGAHPVEGEPLETGRPDAVGHRKLGGIGAVLAESWRAFAGERAMYQPLGYLMRSGAPDSLDRLVAQSFGNIAANLILEEETGRLTAVSGGRYAAVSIERLGEGIRRVDVDRFYDRKNYRPRIIEMRNLPMFLH